MSLAAPSVAASPDAFAVGDIVRLNSDALRMTVHAVEGRRVGCHWHADDMGLIEFDFDPRELTLVRRRAGEAS
jgi:uncharacterized protein YodC (DUF2158 family)